MRRSSPRTVGTRRGRSVGFTDAERARHIHVVGAIGTGKSKILEYMVRQDIVRGRGLCLIDPHGSLCDEVEQWCAMRGFGRLRRIHIIRPGDDHYSPGFNPLRVVPGEALSVRVDAMVAACGQAWGVQHMNETPRLEKILRALFFALRARNLTLAEGPALLQAGDPRGLRKLLTENLPDPVFQITWDELKVMPRREFAEHVESTITRLSRFLSAPSMRLVVGQRDHTIDFGAAMDNSEVVLVNLGARGAFSRENGAVLGALLINDLFLTALGRTVELGRRRPFSLYIDEAYRFLSGDVENILDETRKFGLHAVLAHQRLGQLKERGEGIYNAVMGINNKVVLGGLPDDDAGIMAREIMRGDIDLEKPKAGITAPVVVGEVPFWLESESTSEGGATSHTLTESSATIESTGHSDGVGENYSVIDGAEEQSGRTSTTAESTSSVTSFGTSRSDGHSSSQSRTSGRSQTLRSIREERPTHFYSLEESLHLAQLRLRNLRDMTAIVKRRGRQTVQVNTVEIKPVLVVPGIMARFRDSIRAKSPYVSTVADAEAEIAARTIALFSSSRNVDALDDDEQWVHELAPAGSR